MEFITTEVLQQLMELSVAALVLITVIIALVIVALIIRQRAPIEKSQNEVDVAQANAQVEMARTQARMTEVLSQTAQAHVANSQALMTNAQTQQEMVKILARIDVNAERSVQGLRIINAKLDYLRLVAERNSNGNGGKVNGVSGHPLN